MGSLVEAIRGSETARERTKVVLLTLGGQWSVSDGYERLGMKRTRFQDLRRRMLEAAVGALEDGLAGRPRKRQASESRRLARLRRQVADLTHELQLARTQLELFACWLGPAIDERKQHRAARASPRRTTCRFEKRRTGERSSCA